MQHWVFIIPNYLLNFMLYQLLVFFYKVLILDKCLQNGTIYDAGSCCLIFFCQLQEHFGNLYSFGFLFTFLYILL